MTTENWTKSEPRLILERPCPCALDWCPGEIRTVLDRTRLIEAVANAIASHDMQSGPFNMLAEIGEDMADLYRAYAAKHIDALLSEVDD